MKQRISGYLKDHENHWVAKLECGHVQHVRHDPPWALREWVTTDEGRQLHRGTELECVLCDEQARVITGVVLKEAKKALTDSYEAAGMSGLCADGRWEAAIGVLDQGGMVSICERVLRTSPLRK